jgi:ubiquitin-like protein Pup
MAKQVQAKKVAKTEGEVTAEDVHEASAEFQANADKLKKDLDDLLDEIGDVLETNAEEFVKNYVQKGGQ